MNTYLLEWNPDLFPWGKVQDELKEARQSGSTEIKWDVGGNKTPRPGDRAFLMRVKSNQGIIGAGRITSLPDDATHWRDDKAAQGETYTFVNVVFDQLLQEPLITLDELNRPPFTGHRWTPHRSGNLIPEPFATALQIQWSKVACSQPQDVLIKRIKDPARASLFKLVEHVFDHRDGLIQPLYYSQLAERIGRLNKHGDGHGHGMGNVLGKMGHILKNIDGDEWGEGIPQIQSLVVNMTGKLKNLPDDGIKEFWPDYPEMSYVEKVNRTRIEHRRIVSFGSRWNDVLKRLGLPEVTTSSQTTKSAGAFGGGGESESHKRLKEFVRNNPELVGAKSNWHSFLEYPLASLDEIDVMFKSNDACIAVEVKAAVSDGYPSDYERGLFQTVKYGALLAAMARSGTYDIPSQIKVILVLESHLPTQFRVLAQVLGVMILENIKPTEIA